jgi:hypothetical protein
VINLNGMEMRISKDLSDTDPTQSDTKRVVDVPDPLDPNERLRLPGRFGGVDTFYKITRARYDFALAQPSVPQGG